MKKYPRVLLKLSGESLMGNSSSSYSHDVIERICEDVKRVYNLGYEICLVVGGGNICRGATITKFGIKKITADHMGMLATLINAIAIQSKLEEKMVCTQVLSGIPIPSIVEQYIQKRAVQYLKEMRVVIFAAGTGNPFFTTDTGAVLRAIEMDCSLILKGTQVDGVYSEDPKKNINAVKYQELSYNNIIQNNITIMDLTAITLARDNNMPIRVFNIGKEGEFLKVIQEQGSFTNIR